MKCFSFALLATAALMFGANALLPVQPAHLSIHGKTLCGSPVGAHVDVLEANGLHYCPRCQDVVLSNNATE